MKNNKYLNVLSFIAIIIHLSRNSLWEAEKEYFQEKSFKYLGVLLNEDDFIYLMECNNLHIRDSKWKNFILKLDLSKIPSKLQSGLHPNLEIVSKELVKNFGLVFSRKFALTCLINEKL